MVVIPNLAMSAVVLVFMLTLLLALWYIESHGIPKPYYFVAFASWQCKTNTISSRCAPWAACAEYSLSSTGMNSEHGLHQLAPKKSPTTL
jgi:hypothetical protein